MITSIVILIVLFIVTFLLGSIPWGVVISHTVYHKDIRKEGSGNIGTTNAMRALGRKGGVAVFLLDFGKGLLSGFLGLVASWMLTNDSPFSGEPTIVPLLVGCGYDKQVAYQYAATPDLALGICMGVVFLGCILGHIFSPWLKFKGGKGIAVAVGAEFFVFGFWGAILELAIFAILVVITRYVSVGSIAAAVACPFIAAYLYLYANFIPFSFVCCTVAALVVIWAHRGNLKRLFTGTENRIGQKKSTES